MNRLRLAFFRIVKTIVILPMVVWVIVSAIRSSRVSVQRMNIGKKPRLVYGPIPVVSIKYMRQAMAQRGYDAKTFVYSIYSINRREDFDYFVDDFLDVGWLQRGPGSRIWLIVRPYVVFCWLLPRFDVFHFFFHGGFLAQTPLRFLEVQLLHLAGKKVVVMPYGADVAVPTRISSMVFRQGLLMSYPSLATSEHETVRWIDYFTAHADFIVGCIFHSETMPRWDMLTTHYYPIDTAVWSPIVASETEIDGVRPVTVVHAPNHRGLKGSEFLIAACNELRAEGYPIELRLLEGVPNSEVMRIMQDSDIVAEQFIHGYGLNAMEGMSLGKVVMSNLSDDHYYRVHRMYTGLDECPIVNTSVESIKDTLRMLISDPELRSQRAVAGRAYVCKFHSYDAVAQMWDAIYRKIWRGEALDLSVWHPDRSLARGTPEPWVI